jgi:cardiolipin synthase
MRPAYTRPFQDIVLACLALLLTGCAARPAAAPGPTEEAMLQALPPSASFCKEGQLLLRYGPAGQDTWLTANWPASGPGTGEHRYHAAEFALLEGEEPDAATLQRDCQPVLLLEHEQWTSLVGRILDRSTLGDPAVATLVTLQGADFVLSRNLAGTLEIHRLEDKPTSLKVVRSISEKSFSALAENALREMLPNRGEGAGPVMFVVGENEPSRAFVFFDLAANQSVFLSQPPSAIPFGRKLGFSLRMVDALALRSHLLGMARNPVSSTNRLMWLAAHSGAVMLPRGQGREAADVSPPTPRPPMDREAWERQLDELVGPERYGASLKLLIDGEAFFVELIEAIQGAREAIDIQIYIFDSDDYALRIANLLKQRSRDIRIRVLVDRLGSLAAGQVPSRSPYYSAAKPPLSIIDYLQDNSAIEVRAQENPWLTSSHTKLIVIDHARAFIGGMNIGREYRYEWHDLMLSAEGPIIRRLQRDFDSRWAKAGPGGDLAFAVAASRPETPAPDADHRGIEVRPLYTRTGDAQILRAQLAAIRGARSHIYIEQPYVSDDEVIAELIAARRRGVDVRVVLPTSNDSGLMSSANLLAARAFLNHGVRVYAYPGMSHVKAGIFDGWASVGSANLDKLSLRINQETNLATSDPEFVDRLRRELFETDFARSRELKEAPSASWTDYLSEFIADQF